jgi:hypothetical protein
MCERRLRISLLVMSQIIRQALRAGSDDPPGMRAILPTFQNTV